MFTWKHVRSFLFSTIFLKMLGIGKGRGGGGLGPLRSEFDMNEIKLNLVFYS